MTTIKYTFRRDLLPRRFSWLAQHTCVISASTEEPASYYAGQKTMAAIEGKKPTPGEIDAVCGAVKIECLDYTARIFDVLGIDVSKERGDAPPIVGESGDSQTEFGHE